MKKVLLALAFLPLGIAQAQTNTGMEIWTGLDPQDWNLSSNYAAGLPFGPTTVFKETAAPGEGLNSARLIVAPCAICAAADFPDPLPGFLLQGYGTFARPATCTFKWRGTVAVGDTAIAGARASIGTTTVIGTALKDILPGTNQATWVTETVNFTYFSAANPDTMAFGGAADKYMLTVTDGDYTGESSDVSTVLYIDDFVLAGGTIGIEMLETNNTLIMAYPNPAHDMVNFNLLGTDASKMEIVDLAGQVVYTDNNMAIKTSVDVSAFNNGAYFVKFLNNKNEYVGTARFNVTK